MGRYVLHRVLWMIPVILCVAILITLIMCLVPGDLAEIALGSNATPEQLENYREMHGLNGTYLQRIWNYLSGVFFHFDFGTSYLYSTPVATDIIQRFPRTLIIAFFSVLLMLAISFPLGILSGLHRNSVLDRVAMIVSLAGVSMPNFWLAIMLVLVFSVNLGWLPSMGLGGVQYYVLPVISAAIGGIAGLTRQIRGSLLDVVRADYITTARSKGLNERRILYKHMLPNALIPIITSIGNTLNQKISGALIIEIVFSIPGLGSYLTTALGDRDYTAVQGTIIFLSVIHCIIILLTDLTYAFVDPRIKAQYTRKKRRVSNVGSTL